MPGSCCLRRSGHCGRRLTPLIEGYIGAVLALFVSKLVSKLKLPSILGWLIAGMILGPHALSLVSQELLDAAWYQSVVHVLECAVGLMNGTELVWNKIKKSGRSIIITTLTQSLGMTPTSAALPNLGGMALNRRSIISKRQTRNGNGIIASIPDSSSGMRKTTISA